MENKFIVGETVYSKATPALKLVVRRYVDRIYFCKIKGQPDQPDLVYFERELLPDDGGVTWRTL